MPRGKGKGKSKSKQQKEPELNDDVREFITEQIQNAVDKILEASEKRKVETADSLVENVKAIIVATANDPNVAKAMGFQTGLNTSVIVNELNRIRRGEASKQEILNLIDNIWNIARGYFVGDKAFKSVVAEITQSLESAKNKAVKELVDTEP